MGDKDTPQRGEWPLKRFPSTDRNTVPQSTSTPGPQTSDKKERRGEVEIIKGKEN